MSEGLVFEDFCVAEYSSLVNALSWTLGTRDLGIEATDEAFVRAYENWQQVSSMKNPAGWVYRVGLNWGRRRVWRRKRESELLRSFTLPEAHTDTLKDQDLFLALHKLPMHFRSVVVLRYFFGYSERDTAEVLGISCGTVKSRSSRGLKKLREII